MPDPGLRLRDHCLSRRRPLVGRSVTRLGSGGTDALEQRGVQLCLLAAEVPGALAQS